MHCSSISALIALILSNTSNFLASTVTRYKDQNPSIIIYDVLIGSDIVMGISRNKLWFLSKWPTFMNLSLIWTCNKSTILADEKNVSSYGKSCIFYCPIHVAVFPIGNFFLWLLF